MASSPIGSLGRRRSKGRRARPVERRHHTCTNAPRNMHHATCSVRRGRRGRAQVPHMHGRARREGLGGAAAAARDRARNLQAAEGDSLSFRRPAAAGSGALGQLRAGLRWTACEVPLRRAGPAARRATSALDAESEAVVQARAACACTRTAAVPARALPHDVPNTVSADLTAAVSVRP